MALRRIVAPRDATGSGVASVPAPDLSRVAVRR
jgi:hypothetical protein